MKMRIVMMAGIVSAVALGSMTMMAHGATVFSDDFEAGIGPNWTAASAANFTTGVDPLGVLSTQVVFPNAGGSREYLRTNDLDYSTIDFTASLVFSNNCGGCGDILVFFGLGDGSKGDNEEPVGVFIRAHTDGVTGNRVDTAWSTGPGVGNQLVQQGFAPGPPLGAHKAIMQKSGNFLTFGIDVGNDGVGALDVDGQPVDFKADPIDLTVGPTDFLNSTNSAIFFGTGNLATTHALDDFTMQGVIPEPSTFTLAALGLLWMGLPGFARRRRK